MIQSGWISNHDGLKIGNVFFVFVGAQLARVREVVPQAKKEDMLLVLQHFDGDVPRTIQAFTEGTVPVGTLMNVLTWY